MKSLIAGHNRNDIESRIQMIKRIDEQVFQQLEPVLKYMLALEILIRKQDKEIADLKQVKLFPEGRNVT